MKQDNTGSYCASRFQARRRPPCVVRVGAIGIGGAEPLRIQSMTTTPTLDVAATVKQCIALAEAGCEIVRITAQNVEAARALKAIHSDFRAAGFVQPLVADIHFLPAAAMEAVEHVEKVRINPGNYADKKRFAQREYTDAEYAAELDRIRERFLPLVLRCRELGRALRIGTNHGSLSDRIMNRYGDTPLGMVESALEFVRIAEAEGFHDVILSMKASHPKIMVQAYRLAAAKMAAEGMAYPLHLGVTEAGDGEDARVKSAIGIGALLYDGLGDTIRVSLTEDPVREIPVARLLAEQMTALWAQQADVPLLPGDDDGIDPYRFERRFVRPIALGPNCRVASDQPPRVIVPSAYRTGEDLGPLRELGRTQALLKQTPIEGLLMQVGQVPDPAVFTELASYPFFRVLELEEPSALERVFECWDSLPEGEKPSQTLVLCCAFSSDEKAGLSDLVSQAQSRGMQLALDVLPEALEVLAPTLQTLAHHTGLIVTCSQKDAHRHPVGSYRALAALLDRHDLSFPLWLRYGQAQRSALQDDYDSSVLDASAFIGSLLIDGLGDLVSLETPLSSQQRAVLAYNILQGARARTVKTEYVACPSCGRTLFDLQSTTQAIRARTGHLKGVTIAVMGCIVNGPGEMADADFGYVGGAPGKVNLYRGKECVQYHVPEADAVDQLIDLIKKENKWVEPPEK